MSSRVFVPFDNNPTSVSVKTASYTIPVGKYAKVYVECDSGGQFTINGSVAVDTDPFLNADISASNAGVIYTVPSGYYLHLNDISANSTTSLYFNGNVASLWSLSASNAPRSEWGLLGPGGTITTSQNVAIQGSGALIPSNATHRQAEFFLPSGTVISGSGNWKATVMEYNAVT